MRHWRSAAIAALALLGGAATARMPGWQVAWGAAQMRVEGPAADRVAKAGAVTIRQIVHVSAAGSRVRIRLSNIAGDAPLRIAAASLARGTPGKAAVAAPRALRFAGAPGIVIAPGAEAYSDPLPIPVVAGDDLAISLFFPQPAAIPTGHPGARASTFLVAGDATASPDLADAARIGGWWSLADVEVQGGTAPRGTIVAIGDSITDGYGIVDDSNTRWPDLLARRLSAATATRGLSVVNAGIGGNRVLLDGLGPNLLARFDRDVIARPGVTHVIVLEGVNDLGVLTRDHPVGAAEHQAMVAAITGAYRQMAERAHAHGLMVIGGTITPFAGSDYYHPGAETEADRQAINAFIRTSGTFDAVVDFDRALRDPARPDRLLAAYDSGDHLHPSAAGYRAMADAVPLALFHRARR
ncbi:hypothetical protein GCM10011380_16210 [Sphingomonas metalli]|uniref:SGNH hydrolase-type esterase domain-containing protein n=2 Tax=Sphingomonas metalli TaxID=1779358 RepID=A0A916T123_9SPHN|nr:hypothetical protein GCM10011380_16210 [Sphingomonas metalli]